MDVPRAPAEPARRPSSSGRGLRFGRAAKRWSGAVLLVVAFVRLHSCAFFNPTPSGRSAGSAKTFGMSPMPQAPRKGESVVGLKEWLRRLELRDRLKETNEWCNEMGAAVLSEVAEASEDLADALELSGEARERLIERGLKEYKSMDLYGDIPMQPDVRPAEDLMGVTMPQYQGKSSDRRLSSRLDNEGLPGDRFAGGGLPG
eukprot:TRINITY_DN94289_c0_g1_i1.p1 TRINITY_DN94289_c0_g1~~TRINITY_DN94289_c0_g1_i1.p1  ORF type:complete len:202 (+),score=36.14 TRINITY_DN94289_c0_g1_i1:81-686(+)